MISLALLFLLFGQHRVYPGLVSLLGARLTALGCIFIVLSWHLSIEVWSSDFALDSRFAYVMLGYVQILYTACAFLNMLARQQVMLYN